MNGKKSSFAELLGKIEDIVGEAVKGTRAGEQPKPLAAKTLLEVIVSDLYGARLDAFHKALTRHVLTKYKQR